MSNFVTLDEAAKKLGVSTDELVEMRSRGEIFGYRDGGSWKFKPEEIERVASEMLGGALDEDPSGSSLLISESDLGGSSVHGSTIGSDILVTDEGSDIDSDVSLVPDPGAGSDVRLVAGGGDATAPEDELQLAGADDDDDELMLAPDDDVSDMVAAAEEGSDAASSVGLSGLGSDLEISGSSLGSDIEVAGSDLNLAGSGIIQGDSDPGIDSGSLDLGGSDLGLSDDDDLVLGGSDLALGSDSGINLMSPGDSGISLEDEPLDLAASGISGLDLASEGSDVESASGAGSGVDFQQDEEFQLSPSGALETDDDSGSQVIELEDSSEFGDAAVALPAAGGIDDGFDAFSDADGGGGLDDATDSFGETSGAAPVPMATPEVPFSLVDVLMLLGILLLMCLSGILVTDVVRNMWAWSGSESDLTSGFTDMLVSGLGMKK